jgi:hypothetical protein
LGAIKKAPENTDRLFEFHLAASSFLEQMVGLIYFAVVAVGGVLRMSIFADATPEARRTRPRATIIIFDNFFMAVSRLRLSQVFLDL